MRMWSPTDFRTKRSNIQDAAYDQEYDKVLIEQSIATQYGILPSRQGDLSYSEWSKLVSGLMDDTPLGRVVAVRTEKDQKVISHFSTWQRQIRADWNSFKSQRMSQQSTEDMEQQMKQLERMLASAFGGGKSG